MLTFAQLAKRKPFLKTSNDRMVSVTDEQIKAAVRVRVSTQFCNTELGYCVRVAWRTTMTPIITTTPVS